MKKLILIAILSIPLFGCDFFKSNDQLLTQHDWELAMEQVLENSKLIKYSKYSKPLLTKSINLSFKQNGTLNVVTDNIPKTYSWKWDDKEKSLITIMGNGDFKGIYKVGDNLSSDFLFLTKQKKDIYASLKMLSFIPYTN